MLRIWCFAFSLGIILPVPAMSQVPQTSQPAQAKPPVSDEEIWSHFEKWVARLKPVPPNRATPQGTADYRPFAAYYEEALVAEAVPRDEAKSRAQRMNVLRRGSVDRERTYWNGVFKVGGGPSSPLRLLQEAIQKVKPGRALDAGMGRGRNAIYLAANGWDSYGYDMAKEGISAAQADAKEAGVKLTTYQAKHDEFDFGESQWDLILCSYCFMRVGDPQWSRVFLKALKPGGLVVFQDTAGSRPDWTKLSDNWKGFHILRLEDQDPGYIDDDWNPSRTNRTIRLVARKE